MDGRRRPPSGKPQDNMVVNLWSGPTMADKKSLGSEISPLDTYPAGQSML